MIFYIAIFIAAAATLETVGIWGRVVGAYQMSPTFGYSLHVRVATLGRFFTLLAAPSLGYLVDNEVSTNNIALCGAVAFLLIGIIASCSFLLPPSRYIAGFRLISRKIEDRFGLDERKPNLTNNIKFGAMCSISFIFTAVGLILVNLIGSAFPDFRASIVQMSAIFTSFGTLMHVFMIDPQLADAGDKDPQDLYNLSMMYIIYRGASAFLLSLSFFCIYTYI